MAQTISTKYLNATSSNGARIKATTTSGESLTAAYNYGKEVADAHAEVAQKLKTKLGWKGKMHGGATKDGYVFVFADGLAINPVPPLKSKTNPKPRTKLVARSSTNIKRAKAAKPVSRVNKMTGDNGKSYRVSQSNDGKTYYRLADFYEKKNAKVYAESYAKLYPNKYIKIDYI